MADVPVLSAALLQSARGLGSATIYEAAGGAGALPSAIKPLHPGWRIAGPAYPVATTPANNVWIHDAIYAAPPSAVLVVDCGGYYEAGYWGAIMSEAAVAAGLAGLVLDGSARDLDDLEQIDFPVFSRGICIRGTSKLRSPRGTVGDPVQVGEVVVRSGEMIVGDKDGVVVVSVGDAEETVRAARQRAAKEVAIRRRLREGERTVDIYDLGE